MIIFNFIGVWIMLGLLSHWFDKLNNRLEKTEEKLKQIKEKINVDNNKR